MPRWWRRGVGAVMFVAALLVFDTGAAHAQSAPLTEVDSETEVRAIRFRFVDSQTFTESRLKEHISHNERGPLVGLRQVFGFLPFIPPVEVYPFDPVELARDQVRLERFYARNGFLFSDVDWLARLDGERNLITILFTVLEGPPLLIEDLDYRGPDGRPAREHLVPELRPEWERFKRRAELQEGERLDDLRLIELEEAALSFVRNNGYPFSRVWATTRVDTLASRAFVTVNVEPGPQAYIRSITVEGNEHVRDRVILRELPFTEGDLFSQRLLIRGQREVFGLNIIRLALVEVPDQPPDTLVDVRARVREHDLHAISAQVGYMTEAGLLGQAEWMHRNFLGGARTLTVSVLGNTGWVSTLAEPDRRYRANVHLHQPYFFHRYFSAAGTAFWERRRDFRDDSRAFGGDVSVFYERGQMRSASSSFEFEDRRLIEAPISAFVATSIVEDRVPSLDEDLEPVPFDPDVSRSMVHLRGTFGWLDNNLDPRRGYVLRPAVQATVPFPRTALEYQRARLTASAYYPFGDRITVAGRASVGGLFPGLEPTDRQDAFAQLLRLRDAVLLAGGSGDVRGWRAGNLGPKILDAFREVDEDTGDTTLVARRYFPYGGTARLTGTAEVRYDVTRSIGAFAFVDAGRVWTPQESFQVPVDHPFFDSAYSDVNRIFVGIGGGVQIASPVGAIQLALGYKVNPSFFDVRSPDDLAQAFEDVLRADPNATNEQLRQAAMEVEPSVWRRFRLHISIGQVF